MCIFLGSIIWTACKSGKTEPAPAAAVSPAVYENGFETEDIGFTGRGGSETLTRKTENPHSGKYSLLVENRTAAWHGPSLQIDHLVTADNEYNISLWVKLESPANARLTLSTQTGSGNTASYNNLLEKTISNTQGWVFYEKKFRYTSVPEFISIYVESPDNAEASFYIDDVRIEEFKMTPVTIEDIRPLKSVYEKDFLIGNAISGPDLAGRAYELLKRHHNAATAGNAMKPASVQREKGVFTFEEADAMVDKVLASGMKMHGHTLAWHQQSPDWMNREGIPRAEALENLTTHIKTVAGHFAGRVISWDVLNEAINDNPTNPTDWRSSLRQSPWFKALGPEYVETAFKAAREADPNAKLYYNDYNLDNQNKSIAVYNMVKELNEKNPNAGGRPLIDGVGMQGHYRVTTSPRDVETSLERFIGLGVEVSITELDVQAGADGKLSEQQANEQALLVAQLFRIYKAHAANIARITFWGLDDGTSWRSATNPTLFDKNYKAKPAFYAALDPDAFIAQHKTNKVKNIKLANAKYGTPKVDGSADAIWKTAEPLPVGEYLMAWQGAFGTAKVLWDEKNLYVLVEVQGAALNKTSKNAHEQDSVEVFVDENNGKKTYYEAGDGQYRVNFDNEASFNPASIAEGFVSRTKVSGKNYTVEMQIPFKTIKPAANMLIGFDVQINGASAQGIRQSVAVWNDTSGNSYQNTSGYGNLKLAK
ncbi:hypothetical protein FACS189462_2080 [Spirochaetia bacterium]|nr:hypothetical protein FACS189462_2080 [Spirochaetia bacterium]